MAIKRKRFNNTFSQTSFSPRTSCFKPSTYMKRTLIAILIPLPFTPSAIQRGVTFRLMSAPFCSFPSFCWRYIPYCVQSGNTSKTHGYREDRSIIYMGFPQNQRNIARLLKGTNDEDIAQAAKLLCSGQLVAFPTETVYGLGADATNTAAVSSIFSAKRRPMDNPLIVHISSPTDLSKYKLTDFPLSPVALRLIDAFWPGPLTLVLPLSHDTSLSSAVTAGLDSVAIRIPQHPVARAILSSAQIPVAAPSANLSGRPSPTCAEHVLHDLADTIDAVVDGSNGDSGNLMYTCGLESTVVDLTNKPVILRPGVISIEELNFASQIEIGKYSALTTPDGISPKAPGMKYRHYAPIAPLHILNMKSLAHAINLHRQAGQRVGILADQAICNKIPQEEVECVTCGNDGTAASFARSLYAALRAFDGEGSLAVREPVDIIFAVPPDDINNGVGEAVMNRLRKAASSRDNYIGTQK